MTRKEILESARKCVCGDREQDYGSPERNFQRIAMMWSDYLWDAYKSTKQLTPTDVAAMLALLKIARIASGHAKADNWIDLAGYAACGGELEAEQDAPEKEVDFAACAYPLDHTDTVMHCTVLEYFNGDWDWFGPCEVVKERTGLVANYHYDCIVQIVTLPDGTKSAGWWEADKPPVDLSNIGDEDETFDD